MIMIEMFPMFQLLLQARQVVSTVGIKAMMQVPSGPFHIQHLSAIIFFSSMWRGARGGVATNDLFTVEAINLEYLLLSISLWTGQQKLLLKRT